MTWKDLPPESDAMSSKGVTLGDTLRAVLHSWSCRRRCIHVDLNSRTNWQMYTVQPSLYCIFCRNWGPFVALRKADVATPGNCSAPASNVFALKFSEVPPTLSEWMMRTNHRCFVQDLQSEECRFSLNKSPEALEEFQHEILYR
jgi:hypothetical protein